MTRIPALIASLALAACAIPPPPPAPDPLVNPVVAEEGRLALLGPAETAFCVSQSAPKSLVEMVQDGAAVRPAAGTPDYALLLVTETPPDDPLLLTRPAPQALAWRLLVAPGTEAEATARRLREALAGCLGAPGRTN